jgi:hypothetical protein
VAEKKIVWLKLRRRRRRPRQLADRRQLTMAMSDCWTTGRPVGLTPGTGGQPSVLDMMRAKSARCDEQVHQRIQQSVVDLVPLCVGEPARST